MALFCCPDFMQTGCTNAPCVCNRIQSLLYRLHITVLLHPRLKRGELFMYKGCPFATVAGALTDQSVLQLWSAYHWRTRCEFARSHKVCGVVFCIPQLPHCWPMAWRLLPCMPEVSHRGEGALEGRRPAGSAEAAPGACAYGPSILHLHRIARQAHGPTESRHPQVLSVAAIRTQSSPGVRCSAHSSWSSPRRRAQSCSWGGPCDDL